jgi:hypothetical protein
MSDPVAYSWHFETSTFTDNPEIRTFSVGLFQWLPKAGGGGLKKSKTIRVNGYVADPEAVYNKARELCARFNAEGVKLESPPDWLQKQYSVPEPRQIVPAVMEDTGSEPSLKHGRPMTVKDRVTGMARDVLGPEMRHLGFRRTDRLFWKDSESVCQIVSLVMNRWGSSTASSVDMHLGVYWHQVERTLVDAPVPKVPPPSWRCTITANLLHLMPPEARGQRPIDLATDLDNMGAKLMQDLKQHGFPCLDYYSQLENVLNMRRYLTHVEGDQYWSPVHMGTRARVVFMVMRGQLREAKAEMQRWKSLEWCSDNDAALAKRLGLEGFE